MIHYMALSLQFRVVNLASSASVRSSLKRQQLHLCVLALCDMYCQKKGSLTSMTPRVLELDAGADPGLCKTLSTFSHSASGALDHILLLPMARRPQRHPKLQSSLVFSLLLFLFILFMFPCKDCQDGFHALSMKGLKIHQKKCQAFLNHEAVANERRKATAASKRVRQSKLKDRKMRLGSAAPGVSFSQYSINIIAD